MLCYAWEKIALMQFRAVEAQPYKMPLNLFVKILLESLKHLLKRGLMQRYEPQKDNLQMLRGKIIWRETLAQRGLARGQLHCLFDELSINILPNQLLKSILTYLLKTQNIDNELLKDLKNIYIKFHFVEDIKILPIHWQIVEKERKDIFYDFLLKICQLIHKQLLMNEENGKFIFKDFENEQLYQIFENFVRKFYTIEQKKFTVSSPKIVWKLEKERSTEGGDNLLPMMQTDMCLTNKEQKIIIDTKFYVNTLQENFGKKSIHSGHLYQIFSYLMQQENPNCEGILLYPTVQQNISQSYRFEERGRSHRIRIETVDLTADYQHIKTRLLAIIGIV